MQLDTQQEKAVSVFTGPALVAAGPGSGKTAVLTRRVVYLTRQRGVVPENILVLTFTRAAAKEMEGRYRSLAGPESQGVMFGTFHSVFFRILRESCGFSGSSLLSGESRLKLVGRLCRRVVPKLSDDPDFVRDVCSEISKVRQTNARISEYKSDIMQPEAFRRLYQMYTGHLKEECKLDFDDCILQSLRMLKDRPDILERWQNQYRFILVDEFQDVSPPQFELVRLLAGSQANLFAVGDDDQGIYGFRGAGSGVLEAFKEAYPDCACITLALNYRCRRDIVIASRAMIEQNKVRIKKDLKAFCAEPGTVKIVRAPDEYTEAEYIARDIRRLTDSCSPAALREFAVLVRTKPMALLFHEILEKHGIPDTLPMGKHSEVQEDVLAYLKLAEDPDDRKMLYRILNRPDRGLEREAFGRGPGGFEQARRYEEGDREAIRQIDRLQADLQILKRMPPFAAVNFIRKGIGYENWLKRRELSEGREAKRAIQELDALQAEAAGYRSAAQWESAVLDREAVKAHADAHPAVTLATIHASKGLEYANVYMPAVNEGILPYSRALLPEEVEEERRLFYVGMTRAKESLTILTEKTRRHRPQTASRFLGPLSGFPVYDLSEASMSSASSASSSISMASSSSSKASETTSYSSSESMYDRDGTPFSSSSYR